MRFLGMVGTVGTVVLLGCAPKGGGGDEVGPGAFDPPFETTSTTLRVGEGDGQGRVTEVVTGTTTIGGEELPVVTLTDDRPGAQPITAALRVEGAEVVIGGFQIPNAPPSVGVDVTFDAPLHVDLGGEIGVPRTVSAGGTLLLGDPELAPEGYLPLVVTTTLLEVDVIAPAPMGDVAGCRHAAIVAEADGLSAEGEIWTSDATGFVTGFLDTTWGRFELGATGYVGFDDVGDVRVAQAEAVVTLDTRFELSTYDLDGDFLADKNTHAQMWLEMRWADADRARTEEQPLLNHEFGTPIGYFPSTIARSDRSFLHADEDEGFVYWVALVDQAAKNEPGSDGTAYHVEAWNDGFIDDDVLVGAFLRYRRLGP